MRVRGTPHDLVLALLLLPLAHHDALDDGALLGGEVRQVRHVGHGGRRRAACGARARRVAVLCPRRDALRATPSGGLFNNAVRANGARPSTDVRAAIDRRSAARRRRASCPNRRRVPLHIDDARA